MAKVSFNKLGLDKTLAQEIKTIEYNGQNIEIKQYLPVDEKLHLIGRVITQGVQNSENNFKNPLQLEVYAALEIIEFYTNISFTDKQREVPQKIFDLLESNGFIDLIVENIPQQEYEALMSALEETVECIYTYNQSFVGMLETVKSNYDNVSTDIEALRNQFTDPDMLPLVKDILTKLN